MTDLYRRAYAALDDITTPILTAASLLTGFSLLGCVVCSRLVF